MSEILGSILRPKIGRRKEGRWEGRRKGGLKKEKRKDNVVQDHSNEEKDQKHSLVVEEEKLDSALCVQHEQARLQR